MLPSPKELIHLRKKYPVSIPPLSLEQHRQKAQLLRQQGRHWQAQQHESLARGLEKRLQLNRL